MINNFDVANSSTMSGGKIKTLKIREMVTVIFSQIHSLTGSKKHPRAGLISIENWIMIKFKFSKKATNLKKSATPLRFDENKLSNSDFLDYSFWR